MKIFSITGWSGSGKTALITQLIGHFKSCGKRVIAVKNAPDKYHLEPEAKDTAKFLKAGAEEVCLVARGEILRMKSTADIPDIFQLLNQYYSSYDLLILEGLQKDGIPKIEVFNPALHKKTKFPIRQLAGVVTDQHLKLEIPVFRTTEIENIAKFMEVYDGTKYQA